MRCMLARPVVRGKRRKGTARARPASSLIFSVTPYDPATYALTIGALGIVAVAGCYWPAHRAASADPVVLLKGD